MGGTATKNKKKRAIQTSVLLLAAFASSVAPSAADGGRGEAPSSGKTTTLSPPKKEGRTELGQEVEMLNSKEEDLYEYYHPKECTLNWNSDTPKGTSWINVKCPTNPSYKTVEVSYASGDGSTKFDKIQGQVLPADSKDHRITVKYTPHATNLPALHKDWTTWKVIPVFVG